MDHRGRGSGVMKKLETSSQVMVESNAGATRLGGPGTGGISGPEDGQTLSAMEGR
jgi:hypothetical protein